MCNQNIPLHEEERPNFRHMSELMCDCFTTSSATNHMLLTECNYGRITTMKRITVLAVGAILGLASLGSAQAQDAAKGSLDKYFAALPTTFTPKEVSPQHYRFTCDYVALDVSGTVTGRDRVSAQYTRALPGGKVRWDNVTIAHSNSLSADFAVGQPQPYMDGFSYDLTNPSSMLSPSFFAGFPDEMRTKTLVWDTAMLEGFASGYLDKLKLNEPYTLGPSNAPLAGSGSFHNTQPELTWIGLSKKNGKLCALIQYEALYNKLDMAANGIPINGSSQYLGTIWLSLDDKQIEFATLREDVLMSIKIPGQDKPMIMNTLRVGTFEHEH